MTQETRLNTLIAYLLREQDKYHTISIPVDMERKRRLFRSLVNIRPPLPISSEYLRVQDEYLQTELSAKHITYAEDLLPVENNIFLWKGDITCLAADAIVNAANSRMLGCFIPCHSCIDNAIHTFAGIQLRLACAAFMKEQKTEEKTGLAKLTKAYNLPSRYILHTVGPIVSGKLTLLHERQLASCYRSCLEAAVQNGIKSIAFCCISTGEFHFPRQRAAEIAVDTVRNYQSTIKNIKVIFNVYQETDYAIYRKILGANQQNKN